MTDPSDAPSPESRGSYWICRACHCRVHWETEACPECGAYPEERDPPHPERGLHVLMGLLLVALLGGALFLLSRDREAARAAEREQMTRLMPVTGDEPDPVVAATATPTPQPAVATATPVPTPTPLPFNPEDLGLEPEPTVRPTPVPAPPTPTPVPSMLDIKDQIKEEMAEDLDQRLPLANIGDPVTLTLRSNRTLSGTLLRLEARQLQLQSTTGAQWIPYRQLSPESRLQVDPSEREAWLEERALEEVLKRL